MKTWTVEDAQVDLVDVIRRALESKPQRVTVGADAVVVVSAKDYAAMSFARDLIAFIQRSRQSGNVGPVADIAHRAPEEL